MNPSPDLTLRRRPLPPARFEPLVADWRQVRRKQEAQRPRFHRGLISFGRFHYTAAVSAADRPARLALYRAHLQVARLPKSEISCLCRIVAEPDRAREYLQGKLSFRTALQQARHPDPATAEQPPVVVPAYQRQLQQWVRQLAREAGPDSTGSFACGLLWLQITPAKAPAPDDVRGEPLTRAPLVKLSLAPPTITLLEQWAARSGLTRSQTAALLLGRMPYAKLQRIVPVAKEVRALPEAAIRFQLQRRKSRLRSIAEVVAVPVVLPEATREKLDELALGCGLSAAATARLLLEPDAAAQLRAIRVQRKNLHERWGEIPPLKDLRKAEPAPESVATP